MDTQRDVYRELQKQLDSISVGFPASESGGVPEAEVGVSLSHDDRVCLCVAGLGTQGCDLAPVTLRTKQEWTDLLHDSQTGLLLQLLDGEDSVDVAGTRIWAAMEALRKATNVMDVEFAVDRREGDSVLFRSTMPDQDLYVLTFPMPLTRGPERVVAVVGQPENAPVEETVTHESTMLLETGSLTDDKVYVYRFPPAFNKSYSNVSRTLYFSNYFTMMGKLRGISLGNAVYEQAAKQFATGKWGMVTNHSEARIFGDPTGTETIEVHLWLGNISGTANSTIDFYFDWYRVLSDGRRERIAFSKQRTTWIEVLDHGIARPHPFPDYFLKAMEEVLLPEPPPLPCPLPEKLPEVDFGPELYCTPPGPFAGPLLREETFQTTLEDADLVGNINFSNYFVWQGRVRDGHFYGLAPGYYGGAGDHGELLCRRSRIEHLREAMPFDRVYVTMSLQAVYERGVSVYFEYFRLSTNGEKQKLAFGEHDAVWTKRVGEDEFVSAPLPEDICEALLSAPHTEISEQHFESHLVAG
jgi:acyl-CoA thioesterase FadM